MNGNGASGPRLQAPAVDTAQALFPSPAESASAKITRDPFIAETTKLHENNEVVE